jgi:hypothetical protein
MPRINLPPGCAGFADGDKKYYADKPGGYVQLDDVKDANALRKLKNQDYASAGLVDAGPEKQFIHDKRKNGRWCPECRFLGHSWMMVCSRCIRRGREVETVPEFEMPMDLPDGPYMI